MAATVTWYQAQAQAEQERRRRQTLSLEQKRLSEIIDEAREWNLRQYIPNAWPLVEPGRKFVGNWHIDATSEHLEAVTDGQIQNLIINVQPRHMKSLTVCVFWMTWLWARKPEIRWLFSSYAESLSIRDSLKCRRIIQSEWYKLRYGHMFKMVGDQNMKSRFENDKTGYRLAVGVGGSGTGEGGDILVVDDPIKLEEAESVLKREAVKEWWDGNMSTRHNDPETGSTVIIMQRTHTEDLTGWVLKKMDEGGRRYETLVLPTEFEPTRKCYTSIGWQDPRIKVGELIWPSRFSPQFIAELKKNLGPAKAAAQLQQTPSPTGGGIFKSTWWVFWRPSGWTHLGPVPVRNDKGEIEYRPVVDLPELQEMAQTWDIPFKDKATSSMVSGQVWGFGNAKCFLLDEINEHLDVVGVVEAIREMTTKYPQALAKFIEDKANGPAVMQLLANEISGLIPFNPIGSKEDRANAVSPLYWAGDIILPHPDLEGMEWVWEYMAEFENFPKGRNDRIDAASQLLSLLLLPVEEQRKKYSPVEIGEY